MVEFLIDHNASIDVENSDGETLLTCAAHGHIEICEFLLIHGICVNKEDRFKRTPISQAASYRKTEILKLLVEYGADINQLVNAEEEMKNNILAWKETIGKK